MLASILVLASCTVTKKQSQMTLSSQNDIDESFEYSVDKFADIEILRYQVPGFNDLSLQQKS